QPRDRDLIDVADDALSYVRAIFNRSERRAMREARRARRISSGGAQPVVPRLGAGDDVLRAAGAYAERVRRAEADRDESIRLLERMPASERQRIPDVGRSAD